MEGGTGCNKYWRGIISVLRNKFSLPSCGGGVYYMEGGNNSIYISIYCIYISNKCGCICTCKYVYIFVIRLSCIYI